LRLKGEIAQKALENINLIRSEFRPGSKYIKYIPILVWIDTTCRLITLAIEEKKELVKLEDCQMMVETYEQSKDHVQGLKSEGIQLTDHNFDGDFKQIKNLFSHMETSLKLVNKRIEHLSNKMSGFSSKFCWEARDHRLLRDSLK